MSVPGPHPALSPPSLYLSALLSSASLPPSLCVPIQYPTISSFTPSSGQSGTSLVISGTNFGTSSETASVTGETHETLSTYYMKTRGRWCLSYISESYAMVPVANASCPITSRTSTLITCTAPAGSGE